ncbi:hypothetical protein LCGC14_0799830 [marine sediment metagenome]|uniref:Glycosyltransferase 2-like domain-containing protein n=1 Tax=marine sediment metagenome TaxID=412755 RepID=A0A0F9SX54_9ZZZZ
MKVIVQIPCYNEEETLPLVVKSIPRNIDGIDKLEILIIDDGSTDRTVEVAKELGVDHIISNVGNKGLATSFATGINECLKLGADIIVNTDGDNQYPQEKIPDLIKPILDGESDIVVSDRQTHKIKHFSWVKKRLQSAGSRVVRMASGTTIPDAPSGFRAYSREAVLNLNIITYFSYVTETIIQAGKRKIAITHVPIETNPKTRESRLFKNTWQHVFESSKSIIRVYSMYESLRIFLSIGSVLFLAGSLGLGRWLWFFFTQDNAGHVQSLVISAGLIIVGFQIGLIGLLSDLVSVNRKLIEDTLYRVKKMELREK